MMIKLLGEPMAFDEEPPQQHRFRDLCYGSHVTLV
ncbi:MFS transporter, partial [Escherichia coli]